MSKPKISYPSSRNFGLGDARRFGGFDNALRAEIWASSELGQIWVKATGAVLVPATIAPKITRASYG